MAKCTITMYTSKTEKNLDKQTKNNPREIPYDNFFIVRSKRINKVKVKE